MKINILTLFPKMFDGFLSESIIKRAINDKKIEIEINNIRDYATNKHKQVDDTPYGGGSGMVLMCEPIYNAVEDLTKDDAKVILLTPQGIPFNQKMAYNLANEKNLIMICGHYEGFDERIRNIVDYEISIGDYVLTGGELPAMVITDAVARLVDGVIEKESHEKESFNDDLLDYPTYTKPQDFKGMTVPDVLLSGNHAEIEKWRQTERIIKTMEMRPDLIKHKHGFTLSRDSKTGNITYTEFVKFDGFTVTPKNNPKKEEIHNVTKMILIKPSFADKIIRLKIDKKMKNFFDRFYKVINDEDDGSAQVIDEVLKYQNYIISNYLKYTDDKYIHMTLKRLQLMLNELSIRKQPTITIDDYEIEGKNR